MVKLISGELIDLSQFVEVWSDRWGLGFNQPADNAIFQSPSGTYVLKRKVGRQISPENPMRKVWTEYSWATPQQLRNFLTPRAGGRRAIKRLKLAEVQQGGAAHMSPTHRVPPPAGWYPDPWRQADLRWWTGSEWSGHTHETQGNTLR